MKMRNMKRTLITLVTIILVAAMVMSMFTACTKKPAVENNNTEPTTAPGEVLEGDKIVKDQITLSMFIPSREADSLYTADTPVLKELSTRTNIKFDITTIFKRQRGDKFKLIMASGEYPDIMYGSPTDLNKYGMLGAFKQLDDMIAQYAPTIKKYLVEDKEAKSQTVAVDGKFYCIPMLSAIKTSMGYMVRKDWVEKVGATMPATIDDWYNMLVKFRDGDPNGNGQKDEVPLFLDKPWENAHTHFADAWGIEVTPDTDYWSMVDGQLVFGPTNDKFKGFLETMSKWYTEGLIDKEFVTREGCVDYFMLNDNAGATINWTGWLASYNENAEVKAKAPNFYMEIVPPPVATAGQPAKTFKQQIKVVPHAWAISESNKYPVETMKLFEYVYSDKGQTLINFGIENDTYTVVNGKNKYTDKVKKDPDGSGKFLGKYGLQLLVGMRQSPDYEEDSCATEAIWKQMTSYIDNNNYYDAFPTLNLTEAEKEVYNNKMSAIRTYVDEMIVKFMTAGEPMSGWDAYKAKITELGIEDCLKIKQQAYTRYQELLK